MNFDLSEDQRTIKSTAREFLAARYPLAEVRRLALEEERGFTDAQWSEMVELGWPEIAELGTVEMVVVAEELGYALAPTPLQSTWAAGLLGALDGAARRAGGRRAGGRRRAADVLVDWDGPWSRAPRSRRRRSLDPTRRLFRVTGGARALGGDVTSSGRLQAMVMNAAESVGVAERAMEMAVAYAKERKQFGRPIGTYQAVSHACAQMLLEVEGARSAVYWAAWALDHEPETAPLATARARRPTRATPGAASRGPRSRSTAGSASPGSTTCTSSSSAARRTPTRTARAARTARDAESPGSEPRAPPRAYPPVHIRPEGVRVNRRRLQLVLVIGVMSLLGAVGVAVATGGSDVRERLTGYEETPQALSTPANGEFKAQGQPVLRTRSSTGCRTAGSRPT